MSTPWIPSGSPQSETQDPGVHDLYKSSNVFINNVPVVLYASPQSGSVAASSAFTGDVPAPNVTLSSVAVTEAKNSIPIIVPSDSVSNNAIESPYSPPPTSPLTNTTGTTALVIPPAGQGGLIPWLEARVAEAQTGVWSRVNAPTPSAITARPGNPNIVGIWKSLGITQPPFDTDQPAWCMGFVNFALKSCGYIWNPEASARAIAANPGRWKATPIPLNQAAPGDIALWNYSHVNFVHTVNGSNLTFIGGNQSNSSQASNNNPHGSTVSIAWPGGYPINKGQIVGLFRPHFGT